MPAGNNSLVNRIKAMIDLIKIDMDALSFNLEDLDTADKSTLTAALNEVRAEMLAFFSSVINDETASTNSSFSSAKINELVNAAIDSVMGDETNPAYDTLKEIADWVASDQTVTTQLLSDLNKTLRTDEVMALSTAQITNILTSTDFGVDINPAIAYNEAIALLTEPPYAWFVSALGFNKLDGYTHTSGTVTVQRVDTKVEPVNYYNPAQQIYSLNVDNARTRAVTWSGDGKYLFVSRVTNQFGALEGYLEVYKREYMTFTRVAYVRDNGIYNMIANQTGEVIVSDGGKVYQFNRTTNVFTLVTAPYYVSGTLNGSLRKAKRSNKFTAHSSARVDIYEFVSGNINFIESFTPAGIGFIRKALYDAQRDRLIIYNDTHPYVWVYERVGGVFVRNTALMTANIAISASRIGVMINMDVSERADRIVFGYMRATNLATAHVCNYGDNGITNRQFVDYNPGTNWSNTTSSIGISPDGKFIGFGYYANIGNFGFAHWREDPNTGLFAPQSLAHASYGVGSCMEFSPMIGLENHTPD